MVDFKELLFKELMRKGHSEFEGRRIWDISNRGFLYVTEELAKKFLEFRNYPRYKKTIVDIENALLQQNAARFTDQLKNESFNLIDMGCGDGSKAKSFIEKVCSDCSLRYCPVHLNEYLVNLALENVKAGGFKSVQEFSPQISDLDSFGDVLSVVRNSDYQKNVILLLGSLLASFDVHDYLFKLSQAMMPGDCLIIGNAIRTGERFEHLETYKSSVFEGWFRLIVKELGFEEEDVEYDARFENGRVEGFFRVKVDKSLEFEGKEFDFKAGDEIVVAILYKYYENELKDFCQMYFRDVELVTDSEYEHALIYCKK